MRRVSLALSLALAACQPIGVPEVPFSFRLETERIDGAVDRFDTSAGWHVTLDEARVVVGPIYLHANPPVGMASRGPLRRAWDLLVPSAVAHAGDQDFFGGAVHGELLTPVVYDVLSGGLDAGEAIGDAARLRSFTLGLFPAGRRVDEGDPLATAQAVVRGTATKEGLTVPFVGAMAIPDVDRNRWVDGLPADAVLSEGGVFVLTVRPKRWLDRARFDELDTDADEGRRLIDPDSQAWAAWQLGLRSSDAWAGRFEPAE